jgi:hypothetical protein
MRVFVVAEVAFRQVFSQCFSFPYQLLFHRMLHTHYLDLVLYMSSSGQSTEWTESHSTQAVKKISIFHEEKNM